MHHWISSDSRLIFNIITDFRFADDIDGLAGTDEELRELIKKINETPMIFGMEISTDKTNVMTNKDSHKEYSYRSKSLFKFCNSRIAQGSKAMGELQYIWSSNTITLKIKTEQHSHKLTFIYDCGS